MNQAQDEAPILGSLQGEGRLEGDLRLAPSRLLSTSNYSAVGDIHDYRKDLGLLGRGGLPAAKEAIEFIAEANTRRLSFR